MLLGGQPSVAMMHIHTHSGNVSDVMLALPHLKVSHGGEWIGIP